VIANTPPGRALVTGASSGIGAATVRALRDASWEVIAVARRQERLDVLAAETGCDVFVADVTQGDHVAALAEFVEGLVASTPSSTWPVGLLALTQWQRPTLTTGLP